MTSVWTYARVVPALVLAGGVLVACGGTDDPGAAGSPSPSTPSTSGTSTPPTTSPSTTTTTPPTTATVAACTSAELTGSLVEGDPGAGQRYAELVLTNTSDQTCTIFGYGGAQLVAADGADLPTDMVRDKSVDKTLVTLEPGDAAQSQLHWSVVPGDGDDPGAECQPPAATLAVIPPDETTSLDVAWTLGPVCEQGRIDQQPYIAA